MKTYSEMLWRECHSVTEWGYVLFFILANATENAGTILLIPPFVNLHMLFVLNHHRLGDTVSTRPPQSAHSWRLDSCTEAFKRYLLADTRDLSTDIRRLCWGSKLLSMFTCVKKATMFRIQTVTEHFFQKCLELF